MRNMLFLGAATVALIAPMAAVAQETTSTIRGTVTSGGSPVAGATVEILNTATGARATSVTSDSGTFTASGLQAGGPYTVTVTADGFSQYQVTDINTIVAQA